MQFDITSFPTYLPIIAGVVIPFLVALIAKQNASGNLKAFLAALGAALAALAVYLNSTSTVSWAGAASAFVLALVVAGASRVTLSEHLVTATAAKVPGGIG